MFQNLFVTGASGLLGSNICRIAAAEGRRVKGLVRKPADAKILVDAGIEPIIGDLAGKQVIAEALRGVDGVIHSAAVIGGTWSKAAPEDFERVNYHATIQLLDTARDAGVTRSIIIGSLAMYDNAYTITETSPLVSIEPDGSPYVLAKLASYYAAMHRACRGENIGFVFPGAMYGPSLFVDRALDPTLFTGTLYSAIQGVFTAYARFPLSWPYVEDAARIVLAALDKGGLGDRYLAGGRAEDTCSLAAFSNIGCEMAGVAHRVRDLEVSELGSDMGSMKAFASRRFASPLIDPRRTNEALGITLTPLHEGLAKTVAWLRQNGRI